jgi:hypothetical protein
MVHLVVVTMEEAEAIKVTRAMVMIKATEDVKVMITGVMDIRVDIVAIAIKDTTTEIKTIVLRRHLSINKDTIAMAKEGAEMQTGEVVTRTDTAVAVVVAVDIRRAGIASPRSVR